MSYDVRRVEGGEGFVIEDPYEHLPDVHVQRPLAPSGRSWLERYQRLQSKENKKIGYPLSLGRAAITYVTNEQYWTIVTESFKGLSTRSQRRQIQRAQSVKREIKQFMQEQQRQAVDLRNATLEFDQRKRQGLEADDKVIVIEDPGPCEHWGPHEATLYRPVCMIDPHTLGADVVVDSVIQSEYTDIRELLASRLDSAAYDVLPKNPLFRIPLFHTHLEIGTEPSHFGLLPSTIETLAPEIK